MLRRGGTSARTVSTRWSGFHWGSQTGSWRREKRALAWRFASNSRRAPMDAQGGACALLANRRIRFQRARARKSRRIRRRPIRCAGSTMQKREACCSSLASAVEEIRALADARKEKCAPPMVLRPLAAKGSRSNSTIDACGECCSWRNADIQSAARSIYSSTIRSSTSSGTAPWASTASWNSRTSNCGPSFSSALRRSWRIFNSPVL